MTKKNFFSNIIPKLNLNSYHIILASHLYQKAENHPLSIFERRQWKPIYYIVNFISTDRWTRKASFLNFYFLTSFPIQTQFKFISYHFDINSSHLYQKEENHPLSIFEKQLHHKFYFDELEKLRSSIFDKFCDKKKNIKNLTIANPFGTRLKFTPHRNLIRIFPEPRPSYL